MAICLWATCLFVLGCSNRESERSLRSAEDQAVLVVADRSTPADRLIDVVDQCRLAGASNVGVITDTENAQLAGS